MDIITSPENEEHNKDNYFKEKIETRGIQPNEITLY